MRRGASSRTMRLALGHTTNQMRCMARYRAALDALRWDSIQSTWRIQCALITFAHSCCAAAIISMCMSTCVTIRHSSRPRVAPQPPPKLCRYVSTPPPLTPDLPQWLPTVFVPPVIPVPSTHTLSVPALPAVPNPGLCPAVKRAPHATVWSHGTYRMLLTCYGSPALGPT